MSDADFIKYHSDTEKGVQSGSASEQQWADHNAPREKWTTRFVDSFKRDPNATVLKPGQPSPVVGFDHAAAAERTANSGLAHKLKGRHMQMIAIGGSIGESELLTPRYIAMQSFDQY